MRCEKNNNLKWIGVLGFFILFVYLTTSTITNKNFTSIKSKELSNIKKFDESIDQTFMRIWNEHKNSELFRHTRETLALELKNEIGNASKQAQICPICPKCPTLVSEPNLEQLAHQEWYHNLVSNDDCSQIDTI